MPVLYPVALRIEGKKCVVVGGGKVAERKVEGLLQAQASVVVISPQASERIQEYTRAERLAWTQREYETEVLRGAFLVIAATDDAVLNRRICADAANMGLLYNNVTDPEACNFYVPSVVRRGDLMIGISTSGDSPAMTRWLRERMETIITPAHGELASLLGRLREDINRQLPDAEERSRVLQKLIEDKVLPLIEAGDTAAAEEAIRACISSQSA